MSNLHFVVHPLPGSNDSLNDRIREVAEKINKYGGHTQPALAGLKVPIKQTVLGPNHIGILLEDGRAYRCAYSIIPERLDLTKNEPMKNMAGGSNLTTNNSSGSKSSQSTSRQLSRSRARILRTSSSVRGGSGSRSTGVIIGGSSGRSMVTVPAPLVPEELVSQAQVVLQGKSRNVIIRELQRTNLDVNLAVNNLLSRDDEEGDETEETNENYVPEDLISLLDNGFHTDSSIIIDAEAPFSEDIFGYSNIRNLLYSRVRSERNNPTSGSGGANAAAGGMSAVAAAAAATGAGVAAAAAAAAGSGGLAAGAAEGGSSSSGGQSVSRSSASVGVTMGGVSAQAGSGQGSVVAGSSQTSGGSGNNNNLVTLSNAPPIPPISDRDSFSRWRDRQYFGPRRWFQSPREDSTWEKESEVIKKELSSGVPLWISEDLEVWPEREQPIRFVQIASLHSEFIGVTAKGELHQWKWSEHEPYRSAENLNIFHPKTATLNLAYEKVTHISATSIRCSVATESNRIATWMDELLGHAGVKLEHGAITLPDLSLDRIASLHTCSLYSVARTENGGIYWWGVLPYSQRKKLWDKFRAKTRKPDRTNMRNIFYSEVTVGAQVCMKNAPMYMPGAIGFTISNGVPKVGQLLNAAWDFNDTCRFKIISVAPPPTPPSTSAPSGSSGSGSASVEVKETSSKSSSTSVGSSTSSGKNNPNKETADRMDMPPPPSPASSTCSDTASGSSHKRAKRVTPREDGDNKKDEECWPMKDVVFVEDVKTVALGRVVKIDGAYAAVELTNSSAGAATAAAAAGENKEEREDIWNNCRLLKREDLQVMKSTASSRGPDCFQKTPRRINLSLLQPGLPFQLLTLTVDAKGIHAVVKHSSKIHYALFNLNSGRQEQDSVFPSDVNAFLGNNAKQITLTSAADAAESVLLLRDGNNAIYPMAKDCLTAIKDPQLLDFAQVRSIAAITLSLPVLESNLKTQLAVIVMAPERQLLMPRILRCDLKGVKSVVQQLEAAGGSAEAKAQIQGLISERCDGNRNLFHACISMCAPSSNKDLDLDVNSSSGFGSGSSAGGASGSGSGALNMETINVLSSNASSGGGGTFSSNRPVTIRDLVRRATLQAVRENSNDGASNSGSGGSSGGGRAGGNADGGASQSVGVALDEHGNYMSVGYWDTEYNPYSGDEDSMMGMSSGGGGKSSSGKHQQSSTATYVSDATERRENSLAALALLCASPALHPYLVQLLSGKDGHGQTPFMLAVGMRAYQAAKVLFDVIMELAQSDAEVRDSMVFPQGSNADQSPLYVLCCNDTCSFTWTGAVHINQDIFECRTCGLVGTLCCCTECAKVCHKGHDCKLKRTSPTAYCDCCEKCKCKALITGNQKKRFELFTKLASDTDLVTRYNSRGESILLFLIQTVSRQLAEQSQYTASSRSRNAAGPSSRKTPNMDGDADVSEHNLEPPRFAKKAIGRLLMDWAAIKSMILTGVAPVAAPAAASTVENSTQGSGDEGGTSGENPGQMYLDGQSGTTLLDKFTHSLITCCSHEPLDALLMTFVREFQNEKIVGRIEEAQSVARRFIRSVARVFVIFSIEKVPVQDKQKATAPQTRNMQTCRRIFQTLIKVAIEELCETADALIAPVRLGVVRPTAPFALTSNNVDNSEDVFSVEPLAPVQNRRRSSTNSTGGDGMGDLFMGGDLSARLRGSGDIDDPSDADATGQDDGEISEQDEVMEREPTRSSSRPSRNGGGSGERGGGAMLVDESVDNLRNEDVAQEESDFFNFNEAETESDSDDNQSTQDAQRSVQTGATAGSDTGIVHDDDDNDMDQEDDSNDSSQPDEEGSEDGETDEHSQEDFAYTLGEEQLERRTTSSGSHRHNLAPQAMQWAIRNRDSNRPSSVRLTHGGSNFVFIDSGSFRRSATSTGAQEYHPSGAPVISLARAFASVVRQITELLNICHVNSGQIPPQSGTATQSLYISYQEIVQLQIRIEEKLKPVWQWVLSVMDATEAQLKFGASLTNSTDPSNPLHPLYHGSGPAPAASVVSGSGSAAAVAAGVPSDTQPSRREFLTYCLSLMRSHSSEHRDSLPVLDVTSLRHIAYVLDAIIFYMRAGSEQENGNGEDKGIASAGVTGGLSAPWDDPDDHDNEESEDDIAGIGMETDSMDEDMFAGAPTGRRHSFFQRSESTLCLGCPAPDPFSTPLVEALPLADTPHMLQPTSKREELFAMPKPNVNLKGMENSQLAEPPRRLGLSNTFKPIDPAGSVGVSRSAEVVGEEALPSGSGVQQQNASGTAQKQVASANQKPYVHVKKRAFYDQFRSTKKPLDEPQDLSKGSGAYAKGAEDEDDSENDDDDTDVEMDEDAAGGVASYEGGEKAASELTFENSTPLEATAGSSSSAQSVRPQIIVTPRKMASAIESATAAVLAKNRKTSLDECATNKVPLEFMPVCVFGRKGGEGPQQRGEDERSGSSKTVIVRAGCSSQQDSSSSQSLDLIQGTIEEGQEISAHVTVETSQPASSQQEFPPRGLHLCSFLCDELILSDLLLGRWRQALDLFSRVFMEDVGLEPGSVICELGGFSVKEARFRRNMEKLRNGQQRDLVLTKMERTRTGLLFQTFKELNTQFGSQTRRSHPPLSFNRVKVTFNNEPGEGSGVARSFYTSIAEAILANEKLPNLEGAQVGKYSVPFSNFALRQRGSSSSASGARDGSGGLGGSGSNRDGSSSSGMPSRILFPTKSRGRQIRDSRKSVTYEPSSRSYTLSSLVAGSNNASGGSGAGVAGSSSGGGGVGGASSSMGGGSSSAGSGGSGASGSGGACAIVSNIQLSGSSERLYSKVYSLHPSQLGKDGATGQSATTNGEGGSESSFGSSSHQAKGGKMNPIVLLDESQLDDSAPLFYSPGKRGFYSPRQGYASFERINAFRNIGRLIGLCLLQNELLPLFLQRHVLKYILGKQIRFHDLAFFDPVVYESLRQLIKESQTKSGAADLQNLEIYFIVDLCPEEGGGSVELIPGGRDILVNETNIYDYVRKYSEYRMLRSQEKALEAIRQGVFDVLPEYALDRLTAEDLRLLLNGVGDIHVGTLISYTTFNDESNEKSDKLIKLKRWLWGTVEKMTSIEKQDLLNFWTGSPALPASEEGFQPMPTVNIRPADDAHLPTANTCISRLYIPLYSSKAILRHKLLLAIKAKNFGFV